MIKAAAIVNDGKIYYLPRPNRHHNVIHLFNSLTKENQGTKLYLEGFITDEGEFLDRKEAAKIALETGQVTSLKWPPNLYSEDLW